MDPSVTSVVFDLGGVLIDWDPRHLYRRLFAGDEAGMERFLAEVCTMEWNVRQDAGRPWRIAVEELTAEHPDKADLIAAYDQRWEEMLGNAFDDAVAVLAELRDAGVPIYALSNWSTDKFAYALDRFEFLGWFRAIVVSGEVGVAKPDPAIYRFLFEHHGVEPRGAVFIDDSQANVDAAISLGMTGIRFRDARALRVDLARLGLPVRRAA